MLPMDHAMAGATKNWRGGVGRAESEDRVTMAAAPAG